MFKDEEEIVSGSDRQAPVDRTNACQAISFLEMGIKEVNNVPKGCPQPF